MSLSFWVTDDRSRLASARHRQLAAVNLSPGIQVLSCCKRQRNTAKNTKPKRRVLGHAASASRAEVVNYCRIFDYYASISLSRSALPAAGSLGRSGDVPLHSDADIFLLNTNY